MTFPMGNIWKNIMNAWVLWPHPAIDISISHMLLGVFIWSTTSFTPVSTSHFHCLLEILQLTSCHQLNIINHHFKSLVWISTFTGQSLAKLTEADKLSSLLGLQAMQAQISCHGRAAHRVLVVCAFQFNHSLSQIHYNTPQGHSQWLLCWLVMLSTDSLHSASTPLSWPPWWMVTLVCVLSHPVICAVQTLLSHSVS